MSLFNSRLDEAENNEPRANGSRLKMDEPLTVWCCEYLACTYEFDETADYEAHLKETHGHE